MVPADARADGPVSKARDVLDEEPLFAVRMAAGEAECRGRIRVEASRIGDAVAEGFAHTGQVRLNARFPVMCARVSRDAALQIAVAILALLIGDDGSGKRVRPQVGGEIAHHPTRVDDHVGRDHVLPGCVSRRFHAISILTLSGAFLDAFIGYLESRDVALEPEADTVGVAEITIDLSGKAEVGRLVREVFFHRSVKIAACARALDGSADAAASRRVLPGPEAPRRTECV